MRYDETGGEYHYDYYLKDHLGNTRVLFTDSAGTAQVLQVSNYYSFGMQFNQAPTYQQQPNDYLYNGKEKQAFGLDWYDYGARMYDPALGRWHSIDPVTEEHFNYTPYHYTFNSPINFIDVLGMDTTWFNKIDGGIEIHHQDDKGNEESYILLLDEDNKKEEKKKKKKKNRDDDTYWTKGGVRYTWELGGYYGNNENHRAMYFRTTNIDGIFGGAWDLAGKAANLLYRNAKILPQTGEKDKNIKKENSGSVEDKTDNTGKSIKARIRNAQNNSKLDTTYEIYKGNRPYRIAVCTVRGFRRRVLIPRHKYKLKPTTKNAGSPPAWCIQHVACWHLFQHITCTSSSSFFFFQYVFAY